MESIILIFTETHMNCKSFLQNLYPNINLRKIFLKHNVVINLMTIFSIPSNKTCSKVQCTSRQNRRNVSVKFK